MEQAANKWNQGHDARAHDPRFKRMFHMDHPVVRKCVFDRWLEGVSPFGYVQRLLREKPSRSALEIACGRGDLSINLVKGGVCTAVDALDISAKGIEIATRRAAEEGIESIAFKVADANTVALPRNQYDFIYMGQSLHHIENLEHLYAQINRALTANGLFFASDYVGPDRMQWTERQLEVMNELLLLLPERLRRHVHMKFKPRHQVNRMSLERMKRDDPSEGVRASEILPLARQYLNVFEVRPLGQTVCYELLKGIIHNFDENAECDNALLKMIIHLEAVLIQEGVLESDFVCFAATRK